MTRLPITRLAPAAALAASALVLPWAASASEIGASDRAAGIVIHDADETLRDYCSREDGTLYFTLPGGTRWELVTSTSDPAISNHGDGSFHPFDVNEVRGALAGVRFPLRAVSAEVFILPYPRRAGLDSGAGPGLVLLSPGVRPIPVSQQHAEFTHELGHIVQYTFMPDADAARWNEYRRLRGIENASFCANAMHVDRPHEIFAEDFRALFGDAQAVGAGTIENADLAYPTAVAGLAEFVANLAGAPAVPTAITVAGIARGGATFARGGAAAATLDLFDLSGRRIASLAPQSDGRSCRWSWDGRGASGEPLGAGVYWARARDGEGGTAKLVRLP